MSKYTTQLRFIVEMNSNDNQSVKKRIQQALPKIFDFDYIVFGTHKEELETKIVMHYYNKEICMETFGIWKLYLEERLNLIMPYYNELYKTVNLDYQWLEDIDVLEDYKQNKTINGSILDNSTGQIKDNGTETTTGSIDENSAVNGTKTSKDLRSDCPQANYNDLDYATEIHDVNSTDNNTSTHHATSEGLLDKNNTTDTTSTTNTSTNSSGNENFTRSHKGLNGSKSRTQLNLEYRESIINIDKMIIEELKDLFMMIY